MAARARPKGRSDDAHTAHTLPSLASNSNGMPQVAQSGSVMKRILGQHSAHKACAASTSMPQERQRGGNTASRGHAGRRSTAQPVPTASEETPQPSRFDPIALPCQKQSSLRPQHRHGVSSRHHARLADHIRSSQRQAASRQGRFQSPRHDFLLREIGERLVDRLDDIRRKFRLPSISAVVAALARDLAARGVEVWFSVDLSSAMLRHVSGVRVAADEEALPFAPASFDLVISLLNLHWVNDLPGALLQVRQALKPDGLFLAAMFGGETLKELRRAIADAEIENEGGLSPRISPFADVRDAGNLLQRAGFTLCRRCRDADRRLRRPLGATR